MSLRLRSVLWRSLFLVLQHFFPVALVLLKAYVVWHMHTFNWFFAVITES